MKKDLTQIQAESNMYVEKLLETKRAELAGWREQYEEAINGYNQVVNQLSQLYSMFGLPEVDHSLPKVELKVPDFKTPKSKEVETEMTPSSEVAAEAETEETEEEAEEEDGDVEEEQAKPKKGVKSGGTESEVILTQTPSLREAAQLVLASATRPLNPAEVLEELEQRNWMPESKNPLNYVRYVLSSNVETGLFTRVAGHRGCYRIHPKNPNFPGGKITVANFRTAKDLIKPYKSNMGRPPRGRDDSRHMPNSPESIVDSLISCHDGDDD